MECPECKSEHLVKKGFTESNVAKYQRYKCKACALTFKVAVDQDKSWYIHKESSKESKQEIVKPVVNPYPIFYCHAKSLNMAFPARIQATDHESAIEKFAFDLTEKIKDPVQLATMCQSLNVHVFDESQKLVAIYNFNKISIELLFEDVLDTTLNEI